jgi:hypothetical protein
MVVLSPALSLSTSLLMTIVGTLVSIVKNTELFASAPSTLILPAAYEVIATGFDDSTIDKTVNGITYDVYTHSDANTSANAELWVQKGVTTLDAKPLTIAISSNVSKLKAGESTTITFTLSEVSADFDATDIVVTGGILTDFVLKANPPVTTISVASKSVDTSLRVKVMVALSSALSLLTLLLMAMVSGFASSVVTPF